MLSFFPTNYKHYHTLLAQFHGGHKTSVQFWNTPIYDNFVWISFFSCRLSLWTTCYAKLAPAYHMNLLSFWAVDKLSRQILLSKYVQHYGQHCLWLWQHPSKRNSAKFFWCTSYLKGFWSSPKGCIQMMELWHLQAHLLSDYMHTNISSCSCIVDQQLLDQHHGMASLVCVRLGRECSSSKVWMRLCWEDVAVQSVVVAL